MRRRLRCGGRFGGRNGYVLRVACSVILWKGAFAWWFDGMRRDLLQFFDANVAEGNVSVVALEKDGAGLVDLVVEFSAGGFGAFDIVVNFYAVEDEGDFVADDGRFGGLPLVARFGDEFVGRFEIVDGAITAYRICAASVIAQDLNFVASAEIEATVGFVRDYVFEFNGEVPELLVCHEVVSVEVLVGGILEDAVFDGPTIAAVGVAEMPAGGVFAVEERAETVFVGSAGAEGRGD